MIGSRARVLPFRLKTCVIGFLGFFLFLFCFYGYFGARKVFEIFEGKVDDMWQQVEGGGG